MTDLTPKARLLIAMGVIITSAWARNIIFMKGRWGITQESSCWYGFNDHKGIRAPTFDTRTEALNWLAEQ